MRSLAILGAAVLLTVGGALPCAAQEATVPAAARAPDPDPARLTLAREVIALAFPPERRRAMLVQISDTMMAQMRDGILRSAGTQLDAELQAILDRYMERVRTISNQINGDGAPETFEAMARAYARVFSRDELVQIRAFLATPAGAHYLQGSLDILGDPDVAEANRAQMARAFAAMEPLMTELRRDVEAYVAGKHPRR